MSQGGQEDIEILVHTTAPSRAVDDIRHRAFAVAYLGFKPKRRVLLDEGNNGVEEVSQTLREADHEIPSPSLVPVVTRQENSFPVDEDGSYVESQSQPAPTCERRITRSYLKSTMMSSSSRVGTRSQGHSFISDRSFDSQPSPGFAGLTGLSTAASQGALQRSSFGSPQLSFNGVFDNRSSQDFRHVPGFRATPPSGTMAALESSWKTPPEEVLDSQSTCDKAFPEFSSPTRILELFLQATSSRGNDGEAATNFWEQEAKAREEEGVLARAHDQSRTSGDSSEHSYNLRGEQTDISSHIGEPTEEDVSRIGDQAKSSYGLSSGISSPQVPEAFEISTDVTRGVLDTPLPVGRLPSIPTLPHLSEILETPCIPYPRPLLRNTHLIPSDGTSIVEETPTRPAVFATTNKYTSASRKRKVSGVSAPSGVASDVPNDWDSPSSSTPRFSGIFPRSSAVPQNTQIVATSPVPLPTQPHKKRRVYNQSKYEVHPPLPRTSSLTLPLEETLLTTFIADLTKKNQLYLPDRYKPLSQSRPLRDTERGYWSISTEDWPAEIFDKSWQVVAKVIADGRAGWGVWMELRPRTVAPAGHDDVGKREWRIYCWGKIVSDIWLLVYTMSQRTLKVVGGARWIDGEEVHVVIMPPGDSVKDKGKGKAKERGVVLYKR